MNGRIWSLPLVAALVGLAGLAMPLSAALCTVPGTHSAVQAAIDDPVCTEIVLSTQTYSESIWITRSLILRGLVGGPATLEGKVTVDGAGIRVGLRDLIIQNGCLDSALEVDEAAEVEGSNLDVIRSEGLPCPPSAVDSIFDDDFESGDTSAWSSTVP